MIFIDNVSVSFGEVSVLHQFSLQIPRQGIVGLSGPSGCGKSTFLRLLAGLQPPSGGTVTGLHPHQCAMVFQENRLLPRGTVEEQIGNVLPAQLHHTVPQWLAMVELEGTEGMETSALSGGMARRLALTRGLAYGHSLEGGYCLLDEPFAGVDYARGLRILERMKARGIAALLATHEPNILAQFDRVIALEGPPLTVVDKNGKQSQEKV